MNIDKFLTEVKRAREKHPGPYTLRQWHHHLMSEWHEALAEEPGSQAMRTELMHVGVVVYRTYCQFGNTDYPEYELSEVVACKDAWYYDDVVCIGQIFVTLNAYIRAIGECKMEKTKEKLPQCYIFYMLPLTAIVLRMVNDETLWNEK